MLSHLALALLGSIALQQQRASTIEVISGCRTDAQSVKVVDEAGKPLTSAFYEDSEGVETEADARGWIHIPSSKENCNPTVSAPGKGSVRIDLEGGRAKGATVRLKRAHRVKFHITQNGEECVHPLAWGDFTRPAIPRSGAEPMLHAGAQDVTATCDSQWRGPQLTTRVTVKPVDGQVFEIEIPDPSLEDPANHLELRGKVRGKLPEHERARIICGELIRDVGVSAQGEFVFTHLPEWPRCKVELWHSEFWSDQAALISLPSGPVEIDLRR